MGPICGVYFKLRAATIRACERGSGGTVHLRHTETSSLWCFAANELLWAMSAGVTQKQCLCMIAQSQQLMQLGLSGKARLYNKQFSGGIWIVLIQYRLAGRRACSDESFRAVYALCGTIQSSKICRQHQITKHEHWLWAGTIPYCCVLPEHVICQRESSRWTEKAARWSHIEDNLLCPEAMLVLIIRLNSMPEFIHSVKVTQRHFK